MLAKKNLAGLGLTVLVALLLSGCTPAGPQALITGRELLEAGDAPKAMERFKVATSLMSSNAQAWNFLGLAAHQSGSVTQALAAYQQAIRLDQSFVEARFNLGCLHADQNKIVLAKDAFTTCTVLRPGYTDAWLLRAQCEAQLKDYATAESSLREALRQQPGNAELFNALGLVQLQRNKPRDAAQSFFAATKTQPVHAAALLNLAIVSYQQLNDRPAALNYFRQYLALTPRPADWDSVNAMVQSLQTPARTAAISNAEPSRVSQPAVARPTPIVQRPPTNAKPETVSSPNSSPVVSPPAVNAAPVETVKLAPEPVIRSAPTDTAPQTAARKTEMSAPAKVSVAAKTNAAVSEKRGVFGNLFRKDSKPAPRVTPLPDASLATVPPAPAPSPVSAGGFPRYTYLSPARPAGGNKSEGERLLAQGRREQDSRKLTEAVQSYRAAVAADPGNYDAQFALGFASFQIRSYKLSAWAWEHALAIHPDSTDARYNFALALRVMNHVVEAAAELEKVLAMDDKVTKAHLVLGSIYAEQLRDYARAREHYRRVLDLEPGHPRGAEIRQWLVNNKS
jgi:tetratricopeptide (TPR) repeat protein